MNVVRRLGIGMAIGGLAAGALSGSAGAAATASEKAQAQKALVSLADLPHGWTSTQVPATSAGTLGGGSSLARCLGVPASLISDNPPREASPLFQAQGGSELVQDTVSIYRSAAFARQVYAAISSRKTAGCLGAALNAAGSTSGSSGRVAVARVASPKGTVAFTLNQTVTSGTASTPTSTEVIYFFKGQYGDGLDVETAGSQPATSLTDHLVAVAKARL